MPSHLAFRFLPVGALLLGALSSCAHTPLNKPELRFNVDVPHNQPVTVFLSDASGKLLETRELNHDFMGAGEVRFATAPQQGTVTVAYLGKTSQDATGTLPLINRHRLFTYPVQQVQNRTVTLYTDKNPLLTSLAVNVTFPAAEDGAEFPDAVVGTTPLFQHLDVVSPAAEQSEVTLHGGLYGDGIQTDGLFTPVVYAVNSMRKPIAYATLLDLQPPQAKHLHLELGKPGTPGAWKTDLKTVTFDLQGPLDASTEGCVALHTIRKEVYSTLPETCSTPWNGQNSIELSTAYPENHYDGLGFEAYYFETSPEGFVTQYLDQEGLDTLPDPVVVRKQDMLTVPQGMKVTGTNTLRPELSWTGLPQGIKGAKELFLTASINSRSAAGDYRWFLELPLNSKQVKVPELPASLVARGFAPREMEGGRKHSIVLSFDEISTWPETGLPSRYRSVSKGLKFSPEAVSLQQNISGEKGAFGRKFMELPELR